MLPHVLGAVLIFPGAVVVNYAGRRFFPSRTWTGDPRRARLAGWLSTPLVWGLPLLSAAFEIGPGSFLRQTFDSIGAWIVHVVGLGIVGSTLSLAIAWSLPPRPPVLIRRPIRRLRPPA
jgi:hypothetical protein